jgi:hypothetical protein
MFFTGWIAPAGTVKTSPAVNGIGGAPETEPEPSGVGIVPDEVSIMIFLLRRRDEYSVQILPRCRMPCVTPF